MSEDTERYIIPERVRELQRDSLEERARRAREWVDENLDEATVIATFLDSFVVVEGDGRVVERPCTWDGADLEVHGEDILEGVAVDRAEMGKYVCDRLREVSSSVFDGDVSEARRKLDDVDHLLDEGARGWFIQALTERVDAETGGAWRDVLAESGDVGSDAIRLGVDLNRYDHRNVGESVLIRGSVEEIMVDADSLADRVEESVRAESTGEPAASLASDLDRLVDLAETAAPYLTVSPDEDVEAFRDALARALNECARGYVAIEGRHHERTTGKHS